MQQIRLSNYSFEGDNNVYLFDDGPETVLVDTGDWMDETEAQLEDAFDERGLTFADVDRIFLTHWHGDHVGLARTIQQAGGAEVFVHEADAPLVSGDQSAWDEMEAKQREYFDHWGMPTEEQQTLERIFGTVPIRERPPEVTPLSDGDTFEVNGRKLRVKHAPGHAAGLCLYELTDQNEAITGDALLPQYTPNVGGADVRVDKPLAKYLDTLQGIVEADYDRAWPGHRDVIEEPAERAAFIIHHHEERAWRVLDALDRLGPSNAWEVSAELFGDLEHIHILHGPGEAFAHLEHLQNDGKVECEGSEYFLADGVSEELDALETETWSLVE